MPYLVVPPLSTQIVVLLLLALPVACISWTMTHEEIFREPRDFCKDRSRDCRKAYQRKFFFILTCEYCLSHYVTAALIVVTSFRMVFDSWLGYLIAGFSIVWIANIYMAIFGHLRLEIKSQRVEIARQERDHADEEVFQ